MTIVINLGLHGGCISGIFITGIFGNFYTKRGGGFLTFKTGIPGGLDVCCGCSHGVTCCSLQPKSGKSQLISVICLVSFSIPVLCYRKSFGC